MHRSLEEICLGFAGRRDRPAFQGPSDPHVFMDYFVRCDAPSSLHMHRNEFFDRHLLGRMLDSQRLVYIIGVPMQLMMITARAGERRRWVETIALTWLSMIVVMVLMK